MGSTNEAFPRAKIAAAHMAQGQAVVGFEEFWPPGTKRTISATVKKPNSLCPLFALLIEITPGTHPLRNGRHPRREISTIQIQQTYEHPRVCRISVKS